MSIFQMALTFSASMLQYECTKYVFTHGRVFVQSESEVAAINMVYGAAGSGMRAMMRDECGRVHFDGTEEVNCNCQLR